MKHYKTSENEIMAIEEGQELLIQSDWIKLSDDEFTQMLAPSEAQRKADILAQISVIEAKQPRALREVALGMDGAKDRLKAIDEEISALRAQL